MDEIRDQMDLSKEISDAISQPLGVGNDLDDVRASMVIVQEVNFTRMNYSPSLMLLNRKNWMLNYWMSIHQLLPS
jgi:hypothetical protein